LFNFTLLLKSAGVNVRVHSVDQKVYHSTFDDD